MFRPFGKEHRGSGYSYSGFRNNFILAHRRTRRHGVGNVDTAFNIDNPFGKTRSPPWLAE